MTVSRIRPKNAPEPVYEWQRWIDWEAVRITSKGTGGGWGRTTQTSETATDPMAAAEWGK